MGQVLIFRRFSLLGHGECPWRKNHQPQKRAVKRIGRLVIMAIVLPLVVCVFPSSASKYSLADPSITDLSAAFSLPPSAGADAASAEPSMRAGRKVEEDDGRLERPGFPALLSGRGLRSWCSLPPPHERYALSECQNSPFSPKALSNDLL